ncbi:neuronal pentraxin-2-like [Limulus polyphemus]|uniref:Neuronal pentraxin-2-like n=1 Tax=Limulus polyphemus TaxID=6850 RepID=A0ABM1B7J0_LIMPO|nr:neuronal pentraxin-2-like [Limulus polyphemus]
MRNGEITLSAYFPGSNDILNPRSVVDPTLMDKVTYCFWLKIKTDITREHFVFSYVVGRGEDNEEIMVSIKITNSTEEALIKLKVRNVQASVSCSPFLISKWNRLCMAWRSVDGKVKLIIGEYLCNDEISGVTTELNARFGGLVMLGLDQHSVDDGLSLNETVIIGEMTQANFWREFLNTGQMTRANSCIAQACKSSPCCYGNQETKSNITTWIETRFKVLERLTMSGSFVCK